MMIARTARGLEVASRGSRGTCPGCGEEVIAKCGSIKVWHWAHLNKDCDPWSEPESVWHLSWKQRAPLDRQEVVIKRNDVTHRADVVAKNGAVLELQASPISAEDILERERFYCHMAWLFRCTWKSRLHFGAHGFWWKHGALSQTRITKPLFWDVDGEIWQVSLSVVDGPERENGGRYDEEMGWISSWTTTRRVVGKVLKRWSGDGFARLSITTDEVA